MGEQWRIAKGYGVSFQGDENVIKLMMVMVAHICEHTKTIEMCTLNR